MRQGVWSSFDFEIFIIQGYISREIGHSSARVRLWFPIGDQQVSGKLMNECENAFYEAEMSHQEVGSFEEQV